MVELGHGARDFRAALYERYVSSFKDVGGEGSSAWWDHKYLPLLDDLDRAEPILEIGCGDGKLLAYLGRRGFTHADGVDISPEQIELARQRGVRVHLGDVFETLAGQAGSLAAIVAVDVFEHFSRDELLRLTPLLHAALRPGGRVLIQTANGAGLFPGQVMYGDLTHLTIFTPQSLDQLLRATGFVDLTCYETGPIPTRLRGKVDLALWRAIKLLANAVRHVETGKHQAIWTENFICTARKA